MVGEDRHQIIKRVNNVYVMLKVINAIEERGVKGIESLAGSFVTEEREKHVAVLNMRIGIGLIEMVKYEQHLEECQ